MVECNLNGCRSCYEGERHRAAQCTSGAERGVDATPAIRSANTSHGSLDCIEQGKENEGLFPTDANEPLEYGC